MRIDNGMMSTSDTPNTARITEHMKRQACVIWGFAQSSCQTCLVTTPSHLHQEVLAVKRLARTGPLLRRVATGWGEQVTFLAQY